MYDLRCGGVFLLYTVLRCVEVQQMRKKQEVGYVLLDLCSAQQQVEPRVS